MPQDRVMQILREEDPEGTAQGRAHKFLSQDQFSFGSNIRWRCDNYDKLTLYGLLIYDDVDSFPRKFIWLEVGRTTSNPMLVAAMYIRAVQSLILVPEMLRSDRRNEAGIMAVVHSAMRLNPDANRFGTSFANKRIGNLWSHFRRTFTRWLPEGYQSSETIFICNVFGFLFMIC